MGQISNCNYNLYEFRSFVPERIAQRHTYRIISIFSHRQLELAAVILHVQKVY